MEALVLMQFSSVFIEFNDCVFVQYKIRTNLVLNTRILFQINECFIQFIFFAISYVKTGEKYQERTSF